MNFLKAEPEQKEDVFYISNLAVFPEFQNQGIGQKLLTEIEKFAKQKKLKFIEINVLEKNINATKVYENNGFRLLERSLIKEIKSQ